MQQQDQIPPTGASSAPAAPRPSTGVRSRTRRAILDAAAAVLGSSPSATLSDVAAAAGVSRTTLHRYFAERDALVSALADDAVARIEVAVTDARLADGPALDALLRLTCEYFAVGPVLPFLYAESAGHSDSHTQDWVVDAPADGEVAGLVARGHVEGSIRPDFTASWIHQLVWALVYAGWENMRDHGVGQVEALALVTESVRSAVLPR